MRAGLVVTAMCTLAAIGCGRPAYPTVTLAGKVTIDGQPVPEGGLTFTPLGGNTGTGVYAPVTSGWYRAERVPKGPMRVMVTAVKRTGKTVDVGGMPIPEIVNLLPPHYATGIDIEASDDAPDLHFDLSSRAPGPR